MTPCVAVWPKLAFWLGGKLKVGFKGIRYGVGGGGGCGHGDSGGAGELDGHEHEYRKVTWPHRSLRELASELPGEEGAG